MYVGHYSCVNELVRTTFESGEKKKINKIKKINDKRETSQKIRCKYSGEANTSIQCLFREKELHLLNFLFISKTL